MIEVGDQVTVVAMNDRTFTIVKRVTEVRADAMFGFAAEVDPNVSNPGSTFYWYKHEGVYWIRGCHPPKSRAAKAMLAACALACE